MVMGLMLGVALFAAVWMTRPLWSGASDPRQRRRAANVAAYRQRLRELDADGAAGLVDAETQATLKSELDSRLLLDTEYDAGPAPVVSRRAVWISALLALFVPGMALLGYVQSGSWKVQEQIAAAPADSPVTPASVEAMVAKLRSRLERQPDDVQGWAMLGRSTFVLERYAESAEAYAKANALTGSQEPELLVNEGEALGLARDRDLSGKPRELFESALRLAPGHGKALWYSALAAEQAGDTVLAHSRWQELSKQDLPETLRAALDERLLATAPATGPDSASSPKVEAQVAIQLRVAVSLAPELASRIGPEHTLFVFAKAAAGPPMPLAVYRGKASELPREVMLDDSLAMTPALKISQFDRWLVTARVSRAGQAQAVSGDVQGSLTVARGDLGKTALVLVLDEVVP